MVTVLLAACLFSTTGTIIKHLVQSYALPPLTVAAVRTSLIALTLFAVLGTLDRKSLRIRPRDVPFFLLFGLICVTLFQTCWVYTVSLIDVGVATVLNNTAPLWAVLFAWPLLGERPSRNTGAALVLTAVGVALVVRVFDARFFSFNLEGLLWGLGAGITYGLYGIFSRRALRRYGPWTTLTYAFAVGALFLLVTQSAAGIESALSQPGAAVWLVILALVPTLGGYAFYTLGLRSLDAAVAAILVATEPAMAVLWAAIFLGERLSWPQLMGIGLVMAGVMALQLNQEAGARSGGILEEQCQADQGHHSELDEDLPIE
jgi:DME family drug/metabolite transporter